MDDSLLRPLHKWLVERGVVFQLGSCVTDMQLHEQGGSKCVKRIFKGATDPRVLFKAFKALHDIGTDYTQA